MHVRRLWMKGSCLPDQRPHEIPCSSAHQVSKALFTCLRYKLTVHRATVACEIADRIRSGEWKSGEVVRAFVRRAAQAQEKTNCLTEGQTF